MQSGGFRRHSINAEKHMDIQKTNPCLFTRQQSRTICMIASTHFSNVRRTTSSTCTDIPCSGNTLNEANRQITLGLD
ncbi:hypothetical protein JTE90_000976 [Oedothorax gibbosus]|uniref:Uncharacterized protein n=1 Tax=Oedothorax gibbosus TaxID=931172 RepID=A0AAV6VDK6_9ARAC|nr:hypothetical protein JTE90_000976 [Oedothorax gibbosus]